MIVFWIIVLKYMNIEMVDKLGFFYFATPKELALKMSTSTCWRARSSVDDPYRPFKFASDTNS